MTPEGWIVLGVGVATVLSQLWVAKLGTRVAEQQLEASRVALRNELTSVLVVARGSFDTDRGSITVWNGGRFAAIDLRLSVLDANGGVVGKGTAPMVEPLSSRQVTVELGSSARREEFSRSDRVDAEWSDGLGPRREPLTLLRAA